MLETPPSLNHHPSFGPETMRRYGVNQFGEPIFRIVFADSRRHMVTGTWPDGSVGGQWRPRYRQLAGYWIMEGWLPADLYHKMTRQQWDLRFPQLPYQERGDYDHCHTFEACTPDHANVDKLVKWIQAGRMGSYQDNLDACQREYAQEEKDKSNEIESRVRNVLPAFGTAAMVGSGSHAGRGTKTAPLLKSANELGLPMVGGSPVNAPLTGRHGLFAGKRRKEYSVPVKVD
jgi:hypothetical protein